MSKKSDDSIERIFRQALTQYDETTFRESDWLKMEKMLEEEANRRAAARSKRNRGIAYTLTGLTGLIIAVYFLAFKKPSDSISGLNKSVNETQASGDLDEKGNVKLEASEGLLSETLSKSDRETESPQSDLLKDQYKKVIPNENPNQGTNRISRNGASVNGEFDRKEIKKESKQEHRAAEAGGESGSQTVNDNTLQQPVGLNSKTENIKPLETANNEVQVNPTGPSPLDGEASLTGQEKGTISTASDKATLAAPAVADGISGGPNSTVGDEVNTIVPMENKAGTAVADTLSIDKVSPLNEAGDSTAEKKLAEEKKQKIRPSSRWSVGLLLAPEFSSTSDGSYSAPGASYGLRIGYQISNRFSVNTGILRSNKKYEGDGYDYTPRNPKYWQNRTNGVIPEEIYAKCLVYELPVGVQFDAVQTERSRLFVSATMSSYFMISQSYDYTFDSPNPGADTGWKSNGSETYWCSVAMVSAGYERYIHNSFAIGVEPYFKASLSEIGWPNIKLYSAGAYVTLRYRFMKK